MRLFHSAEVDKSAFQGNYRACFVVERFINERIAVTSLSDLDIQIGYVPIIMSEDFLELFPARSRLQRAEKKISCAPQLPHEPFVSGTLVEQVRLYVGGLHECISKLSKLGANGDQVQLFKGMLDDAAAMPLSLMKEYVSDAFIELSKLPHFQSDDERILALKSILTESPSGRELKID